jgi:hypothetical protein
VVVGYRAAAPWPGAGQAAWKGFPAGAGSSACEPQVDAGEGPACLLSRTTPDTIDRTLRMHGEIFAAIEGGQAEQCRRLVVEHLATVARRMGSRG